MHDDNATYPPLNTLKRVAEDVWIVDGPVIRFGMPWPKMPFPTRMTIIRLDGDALFIHSPTPLTAELRVEIAKIGTPRWVIGPNRIHYWWIPDWHATYPEAQVYLAPRILEQAGSRIDFNCQILENSSGYPWDRAIWTLPITGDYMTEVEFFHIPSHTLILTDFIENFEPAKLGAWWMRLLTRIGHAQHPDGQMPRDMRLTFRKQRPQLKTAIETMLAWNPERVIIAHGKWYAENGKAELLRAFRWLLGGKGNSPPAD